MTYMDSKEPDQAKETYTYQYDKNSNITEEKIVSRYAMADGKGIDYTRSYTYDTVGRLKMSHAVDHTEGSLKNKQTTYAYDEVGNRTKETVGDEVTNYAYNGLNQLTGSETKKAGEIGEEKTISKNAYGYDRNGNQIEQSDSVTGEKAELSYNAVNRLGRYEACKNGAALLTQENQYNGNGQRIRKKETQGAEVKDNHYYYQGPAVLYTSGENNKLSSLNLMGLEGNVIATQRKGEGSGSWYLYNKDVRAGEGFYNEICYTGQMYDRSTGLYYYNARYYDPEDGRFLT